MTAALLFAAGQAAAREKVDVITLHGGDRVTGEIKQLGLGILTVNTQHMGTISIEWVAVAMIESEQVFEVEESDGERFIGVIGPSEDGEEFEVEGDDGVFVLTHDDIVRIAQLEERWRERWRGYVDLGASFASANNQKDLTLDAEGTYRNKKFKLTNTLSVSSNERDDAARTSRSDLTSNYQRFLRKRWFWYSELKFGGNEELNLQLRSTASGGIGRYLLQTPRSQLFLAAGLSAVREDYYEQDPGEWSSEAVLNGDYELFIFEGRETTLTTKLSLIPSLTVSGRYRVEFSASFRRKMVRDFTVSLTVEESYDSKPPEAAESSDTRLRTSLGWSF